MPDALTHLFVGVSLALLIRMDSPKSAKPSLWNPMCLAVPAYSYSFHRLQ